MKNEKIGYYKAKAFFPCFVKYLTDIKVSKCCCTG